jgi:peptidyl-prolyl cis-trans isomerase C
MRMKLWPAIQIGISRILRHLVLSGAGMILVACGPEKAARIHEFESEEPFNRDQTLATFDDRVVSVGDFLNLFAQTGSFVELWNRARSGNETSYLIEVLNDMGDTWSFAERAQEKGYVDSKAIDDYIARIRFEKIVNLYYLREIFLKVDVTEEDLREYYEQVKEERFAIPQRIKIKWIFISKDKWGWEEAEKRAEDVQSLLEGKREFEELMHTYSDSDSPQRFMDYGWYQRGDLQSNPEFEDALFALKRVGEHTGPVRARNGFHFGKLTGVKEEGVVQYETARLLIRDELVQARVEGRLEELVKEGLETMAVEKNFDLLDQPDAPDDAVLFRVGDYRYPLGWLRFAALAQGLDRRSEQEQYLERAIRDAIIYQFAIEAGYGRLDIESLARPAVKAYLAQIYLTKAIDDQVSVSESEILAYYDENRERFVSNTKIHPHWILIRAEVPEDALRYQKALAMREAKKIVDQIYYGLIRRTGEPFADLARKYSHHEPTKLRGGDLGLYQGAALGHRFDEVAFSMEEGEISHPVELENGYCIIWIRERFPSQRLSYEEVRDDIEETVRRAKIQERRKEVRQEVREGREVETNDELLRETAAYLLKARDDFILRARLMQ